MTRALALLALLFLALLSQAQARPGPMGGFPTPAACPYVNGSTIGDCITDANTNKLFNSLSYYNFPTIGTPLLFDANGSTNYNATQAVLCNPAVYYGSTAWLGTEVTATNAASQVSHSGYFPWLDLVGFEIIAQGTGACAPVTASFENLTTSTFYSNLNSMTALGTLADNQTVQINQQPSPIPFWWDWAEIQNNGVTLQFQNSSVNLEYQSATDGKAAISVYGTGFTFNGNGGTIAHVPTNNGAACVRTSNGASNVLLENFICHDSDNCILGGDSAVGGFTVTGVTAYLCGGGGGQEHLVYVGASVLGEADAFASFSNDTLRDVLDGGWNLKMRPLGLTTQNHETTLLAGCTLSSCEQNGVADMPCGGNYLHDFGTYEVRNPDNFFITRIGEEQNTEACPITVASIAVTANGTTSVTTTTNPTTIGVNVGDLVADYASGGGQATCGGFASQYASINSITGSGPYTITFSATEAAVGNCTVAKVGAAHLLGNETSGNNTISGIGTTTTVLASYGIAGSNIEAKSSIASVAPTALTLTCPTVTNCVTGTASSVTLTIQPITNVTNNKMTFVEDGSGQGATLFAAACIGHAACDGTANGFTILIGQVCIENSDFISDPAAAFPITLGPGVVDCGPGGNSNTFYASRTAANTALDWCGGGSGSCSLWISLPLPPHLTENFPDHDTQVAMAHVAGLCGEGTSGDPIQQCTADNYIALLGAMLLAGL